MYKYIWSNKHRPKDPKIIGYGNDLHEAFRSLDEDQQLSVLFCGDPVQEFIGEGEDDAEK